jgi:hypothetical protein
MADTAMDAAMPFGIRTAAAADNGSLPVIPPDSGALLPSSSSAAANTGGQPEDDAALGLLTMLDPDVTVDFRNEMGLLHTITHTFANICDATALSMRDLGNSETIYGAYENLTLHISICSQLYLTPAERAVCLLAGRILIPKAASGFLVGGRKAPLKPENITILIIRIVKFFADCSPALWLCGERAHGAAC